MKKIVILFAFLASMVFASAQTLDSIAHHDVGWYSMEMRNMMELHDGNILANCQLFWIDEDWNYLGDFGNRMLKLSPNGPEFLDSLFLENADLNYFLLERNPIGDDNIYAYAERDLENNHTDLRICFFDDNLVLNPDKELHVPLCDSIFSPLRDSYCIDEEGIITVALKMNTVGKYNLYRVGLDGSIIARASYNLDSFPFDLNPNMNNLSIFNEDPLEFSLIGFKRTDSGKKIHVVVFDEQLNLEEDLTPDGAPNGIEFEGGYNDMVVDGGDGTFLISSRWYDDQVGGVDGVRVTRYDKSTQEPLCAAFFKTKPVVFVGNASVGWAFPIYMVQADNGDVYFAYSTQDASVLEGQVAVVRMDHDLNVIWERFCLEPTGYTRDGEVAVLMDSGVFAVGGYVMDEYSQQLFFLFLDNNGVGIGEHADLLRPYTFYPNPVNETLSIHYSPDVKLDCVEIFDLQGKKVVSQRNNLESIRTAELPSGVYSIRVTLEGGQSYTDKIVKQ